MNELENKVSAYESLLREYKLEISNFVNDLVAERAKYKNILTLYQNLKEQHESQEIELQAYKNAEALNNNTMEEN